jgi:uncharacterized surface protein with fasciclin (FAS1) repeats
VSRFSDLLKLAEVSVLREISDQGPYTLFVPSNDSLERLPGGWEGAVGHFKQNPASLRKFLRTHIVRGRRRVRSTRSLQVSDPYVNLEGVKLAFDSRMINAVPSVIGDVPAIQYSVKLHGSSLPSAIVGDYDFRAHNGYVSIINGVLGFSSKDRTNGNRRK